MGFLVDKVEGLRTAAKEDLKKLTHGLTVACEDLQAIQERVESWEVEREEKMTELEALAVLLAFAQREEAAMEEVEAD